LFETGEKRERERSEIFKSKMNIMQIRLRSNRKQAVNRELWSNRVMWWTWKCGRKCLYACAWRFFRMQWFLNVHVHATFIEERAHDAATRLTRACFLNI